MSDLIEIRFPAEQQEGTQSIVGRWLKQPGELVKQHEPLVEISTDKVSVEIASPAAGRLERIAIPEGSALQPGDLLGLIAPSASGLIEGPAVRDTPLPSAVKAAADPTADLSPAVRKLLNEHGLSADQIHGTGRGGRLTYQDVTAFIEQRGASSAAALPSRMQPHSPMRRMIASHMVQSLLHTAPHVTSVFEIDLSRIVIHREKNRAAFEAQGAKLTYTAYFVRAACAAIQKVPAANSRWHDQGLEIFDSCNIGIAVAVDNGGLLVPVISAAEKLDLAATAQALTDITERARRNQVQPKELQSGTFTISNHGVSGSLFATPIIINQPQSAILGIGKLEKRVLVDEADQLIVRPCIYATLTIDHRVLNGFEANQFLTSFAQSLQSW
ncbi:MAG: 2-oxo acid dehydrogenase subunit E2 [Oligoflexia bacterium]|nr:2-oxo acid dehydrogenase subunit E2 [Oligoflexia bacterium]